MGICSFVRWEASTITTNIADKHEASEKALERIEGELKGVKKNTETMQLEQKGTTTEMDLLLSKSLEDSKSSYCVRQNAAQHLLNENLKLRSVLIA